ncbi:hypothetical protein [Pseudomonas aeruginosa]|uniref:hypothetical protein n=1 Tax=Pseudomonas aeruginosa TaxID=287 RepID=UPI001C95A18D|nr:hypothetical protein [Pseudomonas aeruginosa]
MGGAFKKIASAATLGLSDAVLGATETPKTQATEMKDIESNDAQNVDSFNEDRRRRARTAGISSTILGGALGTPATTATKTLLGG